METYNWTLSGFAKFCRKLVLPDGKPFKPYPEQRKMLAEFFGGTTETLIVIPKKNGKTTLLAALALFHLLTHPETADVLIVAAARDQARTMFNQAAKLIRRSKLDDVFEVKTGYGLIWLQGGDSSSPKIAIKPAAADTVDGVIPTLALVDELHRHANLDLYDVLRGGLLGDAQMVTISTAGASQDNPLWIVRERAHQFESFTRDGAYSHARSPDGSFVYHEWSLENTDDLTNMKVVKKANPAPWHTLKTLATRYNSPTTTQPSWARLACGVWQFGESPWIDPPAWDALALDIGGVEPGERVWCAVRSGAVAIVAPREEGVVCRAMIGPDEYEATEALIEQIAKTYSVQEVNYDAQQFGRSADLLETKGFPMVEVPHRPERLSQVSATLQRLVARGLLHHDGDPALRAHVLAGTTKQTERGWRLVMTPDNRALIALAFAAHAASGPKRKPMIYVWRGA